MKRKLFSIALATTMVLMLAFVTGCNKKEKEQTVDTEAVEQENTDTQAAADTATEEKDAAAEEQKAEDGTDAAAEVVTEDAVTPDQEAAMEQVVPTLEGGLKDVYAQAKVKAGTCLSEPMIGQSIFSDIVTANFNSVTLENNMKPEAILSQSKSAAAGDVVVEFTPRTTQLLDWAKNNGMSMRGHVLVWYSQTPEWIFHVDFDKSKALVDRDTLLARMESYIKQVFEQLDTLGYSDMFYAYDVVNEAIMEDGSYRDCLWKSIIGDDYIKYAFTYADKYAPESIKLYYNDYNEQFKTDYIMKMAQSLVDENGKSLIDGIGCQAHLYTQDSIDDYMETLEAFSTLGLDVQITELDVSLGAWTNILSATEENLKVQGQYYYELINRIMNENAAGKTAVSSITFWGFADNLSWRRDRSPVLYDKTLAPKYSYYGAKLDKAKAGY